MKSPPMRRYDAVLFDLLTALLDSWALWDAVAGSCEAGRRWRAAYLELTYGCGAYRPYEALVREAAVATGLDAACAETLAAARHTPISIAVNLITRSPLLECWERARPCPRHSFRLIA